MRPIDDIPQQVADDIQRQAVDLFCDSDISLNNTLHHGTIQLDKLEFDGGGRNMFNEIKTREDIRVFLEKTNALHDGHIINVQYINNSISKNENGYWLVPEQTKLTLQILVTSIWDAVVEIEFEFVLEWQIKNCYYWDMTNTSVIFDEQNSIIWTDDVFINMEETKKGSYVIAKSMRWRIIE